MRDVTTPPTRSARWWAALLFLALALRVPSLVQPTGNDQSLYLYTASRVNAGGVPYLDAWDQKPPAVFFVYAFALRFLPADVAVASADLVVSVLIAVLLVILGRRMIGSSTGYLAAFLFLFFGNPSFSRLSGVYIRGQCEVFIALAVTVSLATLAKRRPGPWLLLSAGLWLGVAFWLKYNALTYLLPAAVLLWPWRDGGAGASDASDPSGVRMSAGVAASPNPASADLASAASRVAIVVAGFLVVGLFAVSYFQTHGALDALWRATIDYNLRYSSETYSRGIRGALAYVAGFPIGRARADMLWFLGTAGLAITVLTGLAASRTRRVSVLAVAWMTAAVVSIAINGARDLPQYFVQATPALAFAAAVGATVAARRGLAGRLVIVGVVVIGLWKVGVETPSTFGFRWAGIPGLLDNVRLDVRRLTGSIDERAYLDRFKGPKYDATAIADAAALVRDTTKADDRVLVFGFAPGIYIQSARVSASRFFWSRPVILDFAAETPGYGVAGLLSDLQRSAPAVVILQKQDWWPDVANSVDFFLSTSSLRTWLESNYELDRDTGVFVIWRRRS